MPFKLLLRNLLAHPFRALLTLGSVAVATFLLAYLDAFRKGFTAAVDAAQQNRLVVQSAVSLFVYLPLNYEAKIAGVEGVESVCKLNWFGGEYADAQHENAWFAQFAADAITFPTTYNEIELKEGTYAEWASKRTGCIIGQSLAKDLGLKVGSRMPVKGVIFPRADGSPWEFEVVGIYRSKLPTFDEMTMFFQHDYLRESLEQGGCFGPQGAGMYTVRVRPGTAVEPVMAAIDGLFESGPQRVQTTTEAEFNRQFVSMMGNVPLLLRAIGGGVLFAIFFAVLNTMMMAARERTRDAGILKALGFGNGTLCLLMLCEALVLSLGGAALGALLAKGAEEPLGRPLLQMAPGFAIDGRVLGLAFLIALGVGLVSGLVPGLRLARLQPVTALRSEA